MRVAVIEDVDRVVFREKAALRVLVRGTGTSLVDLHIEATNYALRAGDEVELHGSPWGIRWRGRWFLTLGYSPVRQKR